MNKSKKPLLPTAPDKSLAGGSFAESGPTKKSLVPRRHPIFGSMKDVTWIAPGVDLTEPACPEWADIIDEKYGKGP